MSNANFTAYSSNNNNPGETSDEDFWDMAVGEEKKSYNNFYESLPKEVQQQKPMEFENQKEKHFEYEDEKEVVGTEMKKEDPKDTEAQIEIGIENEGRKQTPTENLSEKDELDSEEYIEKIIREEMAAMEDEQKLKQEIVIPSSPRQRDIASPKPSDAMLNHQQPDLIITAMQLQDRSTTPFRRYKDPMMQSTLDTVTRVHTPTRRPHEERLRQIQREKIMRMYSPVNPTSRSPTPGAVRSADVLAKDDRPHSPAADVGSQNAPSPSDSTISCISLTSIEERQFFHQLNDDEESDRQSIVSSLSPTHAVIASQPLSIPPERPVRAFQVTQKAPIGRRIRNGFRRFGRFVRRQFGKLACASAAED